MPPLILVLGEEPVNKHITEYKQIIAYLQKLVRDFLMSIHIQVQYKPKQKRLPAKRQPKQLPAKDS